MTLYHYTSLENLPLIVRKDGYLEFLLTDYMDFDDPSEGKKMWEVIRDVDKKWVEDIWERFVISFCIENDNLAMLKEYANNASGVVLAINRSSHRDRYLGIPRCLSLRLIYQAFPLNVYPIPSTALRIDSSVAGPLMVRVLAEALALAFSTPGRSSTARTTAASQWLQCMSSTR